MDAFLNIRNSPAEEKAGQRRSQNPKYAAEYVVYNKSTILHRANAGDNGSEGPNDRHEPCDENSKSTVPIVELFRRYQVFSVKKKGILPGKDFRTCSRPDSIPDAISRYGRQAETGIERQQIKISSRSEDAGGHQQRIARQEKPDQKSGFNKNYD